ncbi:MAG: hypothetical protein H6679_01160 [Epsilonproteobacteria bacterium]|nr:hypothetical protein [Campylobacterota bacterium]
MNKRMILGTLLVFFLGNMLSAYIGPIHGASLALRWVEKNRPDFDVLEKRDVIIGLLYVNALHVLDQSKEQIVKNHQEFSKLDLAAIQDPFLLGMGLNFKFSDARERLLRYRFPSGHIYGSIFKEFNIPNGYSDDEDNKKPCSAASLFLSVFDDLQVSKMSKHKLKEIFNYDKNPANVLGKNSSRCNYIQLESDFGIFFLDQSKHLFIAEPLNILAAAFGFLLKLSDEEKNALLTVKVCGARTCEESMRGVLCYINSLVSTQEHAAFLDRMICEQFSL